MSPLHFSGCGAIRDETPRYMDLNDRAYDSGAPLTQTQQRWHWQRALTEEDRDFMRMQRAFERQDREQRKAGRSR